MAHLPPKIPTILPSDWPWVDDELFDFSATKLASHISVAAFDPPAAAANSTIPSTPSVDHDCGVNEEDKNPSLNPCCSRSALHDHAEAESSGDLPSSAAAADIAPQLRLLLDPKRIKRILANRQSARRSRVRKLQYISQLEKIVATLQTEVSALSPRVALLNHQRSILTLGNGLLRQRIAALAQDRIFKDAHQESLKKEIERLRLIHQQQKLKKMTAAIDAAAGDAATIVVQNDF